MIILVAGKVVNVHLEQFKQLTFGGLDKIETQDSRLWRGEVVKGKKVAAGGQDIGDQGINYSPNATRQLNRAMYEVLRRDEDSCRSENGVWPTLTIDRPHPPSRTFESLDGGQPISRHDPWSFL